jgi:predicted TIM-barrel fold metal-dependent hydrolase
LAAVTVKRTRAELAGKTIDGHSHLGVSLKAYALGEYPYAATAEGLACRQQACGVDAGVVFPFTPDLYFDPAALLHGEMLPAAEPASPAPYAAENALLMREVFEFCPELESRFLPFACMDPGRDVSGQLHALRELESKWPVYGVKISGVLCQSKVTELLDSGAALLDWAEERDLGVLFHVSTIDDQYSHADDVFAVIESRPGMRFCMAHGILFSAGHLERAAGLANVWVDTAAIKIQVQVVREAIASGEINRASLLDTDYSDYLAVMRTLSGRYPDRIIWGSDAPCYSYICRRKQGDGEFREFRCKATFEEEVAALNCLEPELRRKVGSKNALDFVFGPTGEKTEERQERP